MDFKIHVQTINGFATEFTRVENITNHLTINHTFPTYETLRLTPVCFGRFYLTLQSGLTQMAHIDLDRSS